MQQLKYYQCIIFIRHAHVTVFATFVQDKKNTHPESIMSNSFTARFIRKEKVKAWCLEMASQ